VSLNKADAVAYFYRPLKMKHDYSMPMIKTNDGAYQIETTLPLKGLLDLLVEISKDSFLQQNSARMFA
jgi:hypothetical protein